jgi:MoaA/NifB/PqqE/SkfB family radical SAM enzyme
VVDLPSLHIEPTTRCTLGCPRCSRTVLLNEYGKKFLPITDLDIQALDEFIDIPVKNIKLSGNNGDPIYHRNFFDVVRVVKKHCKSVKITTNGSGRSTQWWEELNSILDEDDDIKFSIDGIPGNFTKYRINGDWNSVKRGLEICAQGPAKTIWKYIVFKYNQNNINEAKELAEKLGVEFRLDKSARFEVGDPLKPDDDYALVDKQAAQQEFQIVDDSDHFQVDPQCDNNLEHFISSSGYYMPCCYSGDFRFYYKNDWWKNRELHDITKTKLSDQLKIYREFFNRMIYAPPDYCKFNCPKTNTRNNR